MFKKVTNKNAYKSANKHYWHLRDKQTGNDYLFSDAQMISALRRAKDNQEDVPKAKTDFTPALCCLVGFVGGALVSCGVWCVFVL